MVDAAASLTPREIQSRLIFGTINGSMAKDLVVGPFIVAFAIQVAGLSNGQLGWFLSLVPLVVLLRYPFLDSIRQFPRISVLLWSRYIQIACLVALLLLPTGWITLPVLLAVAMLFVFGNEFLQNAVWMNLVAEVSAPRDRGRFLGRLRTWKQAANMSFAVLGFVLVGDQLSRGEYRILLLVVLVLLGNSLFWYWRLPVTQPPDTARSYTGRGQFWQILKTHPLLHRQLALTFVISVLNWPILIVYLVGSLHLPANLLMLTVVASMTGAILSEYAWGLVSDRFGIRRVYAMFFLGSLLLCPLLLVLPDFARIETGSPAWWVGTIALVLFYLLLGILSAGHMMASSIYRAYYLNGRGGFHAVNILTALNQLFVAALTAAGGVLLVVLADGATATGGPDRFKLATVAIMVAAIAIGLFLTAGIKIDDATAGDGAPVQSRRSGLDSA